MVLESAPQPKKKGAWVIENPHFVEMFDTPEKIKALYERPDTLKFRIEDATTVIKNLEGKPNLSPEQMAKLEYQKKRKADSEKELEDVREIIRKFEAKYGRKQ